jgi:hypothetical protein
VETAKIRLITLVTAMTVVAAVEIVTPFLAAAGTCSPLAAVLVARLVEALLILAGVLVWQRSLGDVGLGRGDIVRGTAAGLGWSLAFGGAAAVVGVLLLVAEVDPLGFFVLPRFDDKATLGLFVLTGAVVAPFTEEVLFRGVMYGFFRRWGVTAALVLTTVVFVGLHLSTTSLPVTQAVGGIVFCLAYEKTRSLMTPYIIHVLGNAAMFGIGILGY